MYITPEPQARMEQVYSGTIFCFEDDNSTSVITIKA